jgi:adenine-specific DNA-methyltransferase
MSPRTNLVTQPTLPSLSIPVFPSTRYQGSKLKLLDRIWANIKDLRFDTALDAFGGTGCVSHLLKSKGKQVAYNDVLKFNYIIGLALIENDATALSEEDVAFLLTRHEDIYYPTFIQDTFHDIYFTDDENRWLDMVTTNIMNVDDGHKQALAYFALFQACIIKRPYNLFHRRNLYMRTSDVQRSFGNKTTWDTPFEVWFKQFVAEANNSIFSNGRHNVVMNYDAFEIPGQYDLVYIDTPYISHKGVGVDYLHFYHFLEGIVDYDNWAHRIDYRSKHRRLKRKTSVWTDKNHIHAAFDRLFEKFRDSILVVSYRDHGIPSPDELAVLLRKHKGDVVEVNGTDYKYVLSNGNSRELLFIAQ